jgi:hypothetical protein
MAARSAVRQMKSVKADVLLLARCARSALCFSCSKIVGNVASSINYQPSAYELLKGRLHTAT